MHAEQLLRPPPPAKEQGVRLGAHRRPDTQPTAHKPGAETAHAGSDCVQCCVVPLEFEVRGHGVARLRDSVAWRYEKVCNGVGDRIRVDTTAALRGVARLVDGMPPRVLSRG